MKTSDLEEAFAFLEKKCCDAIVKKSVLCSKVFLFSNNRLRASEQLESSNLSAFVSMGKRKAMSSGSSVDCNVLLKICRKAKPDEEYAGIARAPFSYKKLFPKESENRHFDIGFVERLLAECKRQGAANAAGTLLVRIVHNRLLSSAGAKTHEFQNRFYFSIRIVSKNNGIAHTQLCGRNGKRVNIRHIARETARLARMAENPQRIPAGKYDVLFSPCAFANLLSAFATHFSAASVESGFSCLGGMVGKRVASKNFTLSDDALYFDGFYSSHFDDEGRPTQKTTLIKNGKLLTYLHNTSTALHFKAKPTANAGITDPLPYNFVVKPGKRSFKKILNGMKKGIFVTDLRYTTFNRHILGELSTLPFNATFLVENGKITKPINGIRISGKMVEILNTVKEVAKKPENIMGWEIPTPIISPHVLVSKMKVTVPNE